MNWRSLKWLLLLLRWHFWPPPKMPVQPVIKFSLSRMSLFGLYFDYFAASFLRSSVEITTNVSWKPFWFWLSKLVPDLFMTAKQHFLKLKSIFSSAQIVQEKIPTFIIVRPQITLEKIYSFCNNKCKYGFSSRKSVPRIERRTRIRRNTPYKYALLSDLLIDCDRNLSWIAWRQH